MVLFAVVVLRVWSATPFTLLLAIVAFSCPAVMLYGGWLSRRALVVLDEPAAHTHGVTMNYAAPVYDFYCPLLGLGAEFRRQTLHHAALAPGEHVLDVGCGTGVLTRMAAQQVGAGGAVVGIDPSPAMLQIARRNANTEASRARFKVAAIEALPFDSGRFDVVFSSCMSHHLPPQLKRAGFAEVYRVLKPGGRFVIVDIDRPATWWVWLIVWPLLLMPFTAPNLRGEIPTFLQAAGFNPVMTRGRWIKFLSFWVAVKPAVAT
jgi:ubiquinone/menaquinone biosynthesis C-methylase UbiE